MANFRRQTSGAACRVLPIPSEYNKRYFSSSDTESDLGSDDELPPIHPPSDESDSQDEDLQFQMPYLHQGHLSRAQIQWAGSALAEVHQGRNQRDIPGHTTRRSFWWGGIWDLAGVIALFRFTFRGQVSVLSISACHTLRGCMTTPPVPCNYPVYRIWCRRYQCTRNTLGIRRGRTRWRPRSSRCKESRCTSGGVVGYGEPRLSSRVVCQWLGIGLRRATLQE